MINQSLSPISSPLSKCMGLKIEGAQLQPLLIQVDPQFQQCPIAHAAGIPLFVKRLMNVTAKRHKQNIIVRMMSQPSVGLAPQKWQIEETPPVLVARNDQIQFEISDWKVLDDFQMEMLDDGPREVTRKDFVKFVKHKFPQNKSNIVLQAFYPKGLKVKVNGLIKKTELNGKVGTCNGMYQKQKVGVQFQGLQGKYGVSPKNLQIIQQPKLIRHTANCNKILFPQKVSVKIRQQTQQLWFQKRFYPNRRLAIYAFDYPDLYDVITYNLHHIHLAYNQIVVPVSDRHSWKRQLLKLNQSFQDTGRKVKSGYLDCQVWRLKIKDQPQKPCNCQHQK